MKDLSQIKDDQDLVTVKYLKDNIEQMVGGVVTLNKHIKLINSTKGGDFNSGSNFTFYGFKIANGVAETTPKTNSNGIKYLYDIADLIQDNIYYSSVLVKETDGGYLKHVSFDGKKDHIFTHTTTEKEKRYSHLFKPIATTLNQLYANQIIVDKDAVMVIDEFILINLTECFGKGKEPTQRQMDKIIDEIGYFSEKDITLGSILI